MLKIEFFKNVISSGLKKVRLPKIKSNLIGMINAKDAQKAIDTTAQNVADTVGQEILAAYNKPIVRYKLGGGTRTVTTPMFGDGIKYETIKLVNGKERVIKYVRASQRGIYVVDSDLEGVVQGTGITLPDGTTRYMTRMGGKIAKANSVSAIVKLEKAHNRTRGRVLKTGDFKSGEGSMVWANFENGNQLNTYVNKEHHPYKIDLLFPDGTLLTKLPDSNVTLLSRKRGKTIKTYTPSAYHINPHTNLVTETFLEKSHNKLGQEIVKVNYKFAPNASMKGVHLEYSIPYLDKSGKFNESKLLYGSFEAPNTGKIELKEGRLLINKGIQGGKQINIIYDRLAPENKLERTNEGAFELLFQEALEKNGISKDLFLPKYKANWINL